MNEFRGRIGIMAKGTMYQLISGVVFVTSGYIIHIGLGRSLGPERYGIFGVILSLLSINYLFLRTGIRDSVSRFTAENHGLVQSILKEGLKVQWIFSFILALLYFGLSNIIANLLNDLSLIPYIRLSALAIPFTAIYSVYMGSLNGIRSFGKEVTIQIVYSVSKVILVFTLVFLGLQITGAISGYIFASLIAVLTAKYICRSNRSSTSFDYKRIIRFALPIIIFSGVSTLLIKLDLLFVKAILQDNNQAGFYTAASNLTKTPLPVFSAFSLTLFPLVSRSISRGDLSQTQDYIRTTLKYLIMLISPVAFIVSATSKDLVQLFYSTQFSNAGAPLSILIFGMSFFSIFTLFISIINASGRPTISMIFAFVMIPISIVLNLSLIPGYQLTGAALATSISLFFGVLVAGVYVYMKFKTFLYYRSLVKILSASVVISLAAKFSTISGFLLIPEYFILFTVYLLLLYLLREIGKEDIEKVKVILAGLTQPRGL